MMAITDWAHKYVYITATPLMWKNEDKETDQLEPEPKIRAPVLFKHRYFQTIEYTEKLQDA